MVTLPDILASRARMAADLGPTPLVASHWLSTIAGGDVRLKLESLQVSHSFKARGALNAIRRLIERAEPGRLPSIVTASAGNHGRAIAWAAELTGLHATVFTPRTAPRSKLDAIVRHGAELRAIADHYEQAERLARQFAAETGAVFVSPYNDDDVIAGAGTVGVEIVERWPEVDAVLVPIGGGGLISGIAVAVKTMRPEAELIGVEADASCAFSAARAAGRLVTVDVKPTIADGLGGNVEADTRTWPYIRDIVDRIVIVSEDDLRTSIRGLLGEEHIVAEGAGIAAVAAVAARRVALDRRHAAVVISGANIDVGRLKECL
jgi:threonine dehydratase